MSKRSTGQASRILFLASLLHTSLCVFSFPESGNPITEEPPLQRPSTFSQKVDLFVNAPCDSWNAVLTSNFAPPTGLNWGRVILDFCASENGTQYDRYGALWLGGIELLRTTTAEPTAEGIIWCVEKDVSYYMKYFAEPNTAYLSIPNNVDSTYTGIPLVNASLTFYAIEKSTRVPPFPDVIPISNSPGNWSALTVSAGSNLSYSVTLPHADVLGVTLELMASPHGCEEFWYTNIDNKDAASKYGLCGGGVYRELQVYVDGKLAGATYPFPVVYTGGINPFLWRPLTGIMSFDIPAYSFDLTPFGLGDGAAHTLTVQVLGGDTEGGVWYLDTSLLLFRSESVSKVTGGITSTKDSTAVVSTNSSGSLSGYGWNTTGYHQFEIRGSLQITPADGSEPFTLESVVHGAMEAWNSNLLTDGLATEVTNGAMYATHLDSVTALFNEVTKRLASTQASTAPVRQLQSSLKYPYSIVSTYKQDATTMDMSATLNMSYNRYNSYALHGQPAYTVSWTNAVQSDAVYNRTLDHTTVYAETDNAVGTYIVASNDEGCYQRTAAATNGYVVSDKQQGVCHLPESKFICGYELCTGTAGQETIKPFGVHKTVHERVQSWAPVRHPLMGRKTLTSLQSHSN